MRRAIAGGIAFVSLVAATSAFAADLPAKVYTKAPVMVDPGYNWTGFYAGLNGGYSWGRANTSITGLSPLQRYFQSPGLRRSVRTSMAALPAVRSVITGKSI